MRVRPCLQAAAVLTCSVLPAAPPSAAASSLSFEHTGAPERWTVPAGVFTATFELHGAQGGGGGGRGARVRATLDLTPGDVLELRAGGQDIGGVGGGGSPGGGEGGGGASDVRRGPGFALVDRVLVAAGGGGSGPGGTFIPLSG